jgi:hypothetical protein
MQTSGRLNGTPKLAAASRVVRRRLLSSKANTYLMAYMMGDGGCSSLIEPTLVPK